MKKVTKRELILQLLSDKRPHSIGEIVDHCQLYEYRKRIMELREDWEIDHIQIELNGRKVPGYILRGPRLWPNYKEELDPAFVVRPE